MRERFKMFGRRREVSINDFSLKGDVDPTIAGTLSSEFLKHVLYQRNQIPLSYSQMERDMKAMASQVIETHPTPNMSRKKSKSRDAKVKKFVESLDIILDNLKNVFTKAGPSISQVVVILGATVVSPKEVYVLKFPNTSSENERLTADSCVRSFFQQMISKDVFGDMRQLSPCGFHVLIEAGRDSHIDWFLPKVSYSLPVRGQHLIFNIHNTTSCEIAQTEMSLMNESSFNMSGVCPLDESYEAPTTVNRSLQDVNISSESDSGVCDEDMIWYQAPISLKGFRDKTHTF